MAQVKMVQVKMVKMAQVKMVQVKMVKMAQAEPQIVGAPASLAHFSRKWRINCT